MAGDDQPEKSPDLAIRRASAHLLRKPCGAPSDQGQFTEIDPEYVVSDSIVKWPG